MASAAGPSEWLFLDVGGRKITLLHKVAERLPGSRLAELSQSDFSERPNLCDYYDKATGYCCFYKYSHMFESLLDAYRTGSIHIPSNITTLELFDAMSYWKIDKSLLAPCCFEEPLVETSLKQNTSSVDSSAVIMPTPNAKVDIPLSPYEQLKARVWLFLEEPSTSMFAFLYMLVSMFLVLATGIVLIVNTMPGYDLDDYGNNSIHATIHAVDLTGGVWFTVEYIARLWSTPNRRSFVRLPTSVIDLSAIIPFHVELIMNLFGMNVGNLGNMRRSLIFIRILRVLRLIRVFGVLKVARYNKGFQIMGETLKKSWKELSMLVMFVMTTDLLFLAATYFMEQDDPHTKIDSIPMAAWWCTITLTTVGYGDVYPVTVEGQLIGGLASISGLVILAFPISIIVGNFHTAYTAAHHVPTGIQKAMLGTSDFLLLIPQHSYLKTKIDNEMASTGIVKCLDSFY